MLDVRRVPLSPRRENREKSILRFSLFEGVAESSGGSRAVTNGNEVKLLDLVGLHWATMFTLVYTTPFSF